MNIEVIMLGEKTAVLKSHVVCDLWEVSGVGKSVEIEYIRAVGSGARRDQDAIAQGFFSECGNVLE